MTNVNELQIGPPELAGHPLIFCTLERFIQVSYAHGWTAQFIIQCINDSSDPKNGLVPVSRDEFNDIVFYARVHGDFHAPSVILRRVYVD